jgi:hypothetical protein
MQWALLQARRLTITPAIICPACGLEIAIDQQCGEIELKYSLPEWKARCTSQLGDGPSLCVNVQPLILELLGTRNGNGRNLDS